MPDLVVRHLEHVLAALADRIGPVRDTMVPDPPGPARRSEWGHEQRALIVIDVQESFRAAPDLGGHLQPRHRGQVNRLVEPPAPAATWWSGSCTPSRAPAASSTRPTATSACSTGWRRGPASRVLRKTSHNAFTTTNLQQLLTERGHPRARPSAASAPSSAARPPPGSASDLGYEVTFVTDATATNPDPAPGRAAGPAVEELLADPRTLAAERDRRPHRVRPGRPLRHHRAPSTS